MCDGYNNPISWIERRGFFSFLTPVPTDEIGANRTNTVPRMNEIKKSRKHEKLKARKKTGH
jgi:hypothetical protein